MVCKGAKKGQGAEREAAFLYSGGQKAHKVISSSGRPAAIAKAENLARRACFVELIQHGGGV